MSWYLNQTDGTDRSVFFCWKRIILFWQILNSAENCQSLMWNPSIKPIISIRGMCLELWIDEYWSVFFFLDYFITFSVYNGLMSPSFDEWQRLCKQVHFFWWSVPERDGTMTFYVKQTNQLGGYDDANGCCFYYFWIGKFFFGNDVLCHRLPSIRSIICT